MGVGFYFSVAMLPVMSIITIIFILKRKIKNEETRIYKYILITILLMTSLEIISALLFKNYFNTYMYDLIAKLVLISYITINYLFCLYFMKVCNISKKSLKVLKIMSIIILLITFVAKTVYIKNNEMVVPQGIPVIMTFYYAVVLGTYQLILAIKNRKVIATKKFAPFYSFLLLGLINGMLIVVFPASFMVGYIWCLTIIIMNFTIENPDIKVLNELYKNKTIMEQTYDDKANFLFEAAQEIKNPL
ncbi:MAG: hypothetical protein GX951_04425, partial [Mollicutes bacterium]|nr:hypothetical protein [Mollicutes bacterium]